MKKIVNFILGILLIITLSVSWIYADNWDSSTNMQALSVSAAVAQIQSNFKAVDGTSGSQPAKISVLNSVEFEGSTIDAYETLITATEPTADRVITVPDYTGTMMLSTLSTNKPEGADAVWGASNEIGFEGTTPNDYEIHLKVYDPDRDNDIYIPNAYQTGMLAYTVDTNNGTRGLRIESGTGTVAGSTGVTYIDIVITYATTYAVVGYPVVSGSGSVGGDNVIWETSSPGSTQFTIRVRTQDGTNFNNTTTGTYYWLSAGH